MTRFEEIAAALETVAVDNGFKLYAVDGQIYAVDLPVTGKSPVTPISFYGFTFEGITVKPDNGIDQY